jgi:hypothetical protein
MADVTWGSVMEKPTNRVALATALKNLRRKSGVALEAHAVQLGLTITQARKLEAGSVPLTAGHVVHLLGVYKGEPADAVAGLATTVALPIATMIREARIDRDFVALFDQPAGDPLTIVEGLLTLNGRIGQALVDLRTQLLREADHD